MFFLVSEEYYNRLKPLFEDDPSSLEEQRFQLEQMGKRAGWNNPAMDDYDGYDEHRVSGLVMKVRRGDVVLVDYLFSDRSGSKVRPCLVVQNDAYNLRLDDTIVSAISSNLALPSSNQINFLSMSTLPTALIRDSYSIPPFSARTWPQSTRSL